MLVVNRHSSPEDAGYSVQRSESRGSVALVSGSRPHAGRLLTVQRVFNTLPERYLGAEPGFDATYHVRLGDVGHTWEIRLTEDRAHVRQGVTRRRADVTIGTDSETWLRLREGALSGVEAFPQRPLHARGDKVPAFGSEGPFARPGARPPLLPLHDVHLP